jgi:hypothetical protein
MAVYYTEYIAYQIYSNNEKEAEWKVRLDADWTRLLLWYTHWKDEAEWKVQLDEEVNIEKVKVE